LEDLRRRKELKINYSGLDPGSTFALAGACLRDDDTVGMFAAKSKTYRTSTVGRFQSTVSDLKENDHEKNPDTSIRSMEAKMVDGDLYANLEYNATELFEFYTSAKVKLAHGLLKRGKQRWKDAVCQRVFEMAGCRADKKAADYLAEDKAFVFVFETGAKFASSTALHNEIQQHLIKKLRALGHLVVGMNCYRTSQGCPVCFGKMKLVPHHHYRVKECSNCKKFFHRDIASGLLMARLAKKLVANEPYPEQFIAPWYDENLFIKPPDPGQSSSKRKSTDTLLNPKNKT